MKSGVRLIGAVSALTTLGFAPEAHAFHFGGIGACDGCHSTHNSMGNVARRKGSTQFRGQTYLLQGADASSTCLNCHANSAAGGDHLVMTYPVPTTGAAPVNYTPGGDFAWLTITAQVPPTPGQGSSASVDKGERRGHNVVAADYGLVADVTLTTAPGGTYQSAKLSCVSCHDPHSRARMVDGNGTIAYNKLGSAPMAISGSGSYGALPTSSEAVGVYRLLGGINYVDSTGYQFVSADPPVAVAPSSYNRKETTTDTRVAYGAGMSEWCANCHSAIHNNGVGGANTTLIHPAGNSAKLNQPTTVFGAATTEAAIYNQYKKSGDLTGDGTAAYTSLVPFEQGTTVLATLSVNAVSDGSRTAGTGGNGTGTENVMCLTCHRAHAGGFLSASRWNNNGEFLTIAGAWPGVDAPGARGKDGPNSRGLSQAQYQAAMYDRPATAFATYQRSLCNKCHAKD